MNKILFKHLRVYYTFGFLVLFSGYAFYILIRGFDPLFGFEIITPIWPSIEHLLPNFILTSYATLTHVLALCFISYAILAAKKHSKLRIVIFWSSIHLIFELLQLYNVQNQESATNIALLSGTFDVLDIIAILIAAGLFLILTSIIDTRYQIYNDSKHEHLGRVNTASSMSLSLLALFGTVSIMASSYSEDNPNVYPNNRDVPIYLSYEALRAPLKIETNRTLYKAGKIYIFQELLLVSEANKGIHIYDNSNPSNPIHKTFINLPGNLDIAVRNRILYADSFIDLVVINLNDLNNIIVINRIKNVFPYDAYQAIPSNQRTFYRWDKNKGVIIGVEPKP